MATSPDEQKHAAYFLEPSRRKDHSHMTFDEFLKGVQEYNPKANEKMLRKAYDLAHRIHEGQKRASGEPFFTHPIEVARILMALRADSPTLAAALLHDCVEEGKITVLEVEKEFGAEVASLVEAVTKITGWFDTREEYAAENVRKILLATIKDIRVILLKLADRLHNMRTLQHFREDKQRRIAQETLDIYAPIAHKLGIRFIKGELEDLSLKVLDPAAYQMLKSKIAGKREDSESRTKEFIKIIRDKLKQRGIEAEIEGRAKYFYSIYRKMKKENKDFSEIYDLIAIRIITNTIPECYAAIGIVHELWKPMPGRFKDFISVPKANGYQSLHTSVVGEHGKIIEIQIRTKEMHLIAEQGIAAHWRYKGTERDRKFERRINWLRQVLDWKQESSTAREFAESLKIDLFEKEIVVFTPKGDPISLPEKSTPVDFAYEIHTNLGSTCSGAEVNGKIVPLDNMLRSGDIIHILTRKDAKPNSNWLSFVKTTKARSKIRSALHIKNDHEKKDAESEAETPKEVIEALEIEGFSGKQSQIKLSKCCSPTIYDPVRAFHTKDGKITIHRKDCPNIQALKDIRSLIARWKERKEKEITRLKVVLNDRPGVLADILNMLAQRDVNIKAIHTRSKKEHVSITLSLQFQEKKQAESIEKLVLALRGMKNVIDLKILE
ncbi:MAG TPA: bifunctional (p)ppGpp synthetase/guanosine-3',5'-bis(diphosphate) 3'-pyrophosphohydrolase [Candidatus Nanoarchaeia archaeon]|nr:bifunctional (p)ppGpp synthetase/guanosine-3',5'-bis(diphosphate) 3'-pyrophosphohydrolase [Candidatus Nanoarchaeia archaeon]